MSRVYGFRRLTYVYWLKIDLSNKGQGESSGLRAVQIIDRAVSRLIVRDPEPNQDDTEPGLACEGQEWIQDRKSQ